MPKLWKLKPIISEEAMGSLSRYPFFISQLLYNRGILTEASAEAFLKVDYKSQHSPFLFKDMEKAVKRIFQAIEKKETIYIYGDYDADAVTANAVLQQAFFMLNFQVSSYIPDRFTEGYGLNLEAFEKIKKEGCSLVITVDCGTNSVDVADFCNSNNIDLIITDHHEIIGILPKAHSLINPKNANDNYPFKNITGVGVAFKLASALLKDLKAKIYNPTLPEGSEKWLLDLVAIGTVADCHSLMGENRIFVKYGLLVLPKTKWQGLRALCVKAGLNFEAQKPDTYSLGFIIAPRLNAAGRLEHANIALSILLEQDQNSATLKADNLEKINIRRQELTMRVVSEARAQAETMTQRKMLLLMDSDWPKGIVGLVAGKIAEEFHKPTIVLEKGPLESTGSARTVGNFNVVESLKYASEFLLRFGGHKQAAGLTLKTSEYENFYAKLLEFAEKNLTENDLTSEIELEAELLEVDISTQTLEALEGFGPFGVDNQKPKFLISKALLLSVKFVGKEQQHMQLLIQKGNKKISGIMFNAGNFARNLKIGDNIDIVAELIEDNWKGKKEVKLRVIDLRM